MAYIGNSASIQQYAPTIQYFSGNASTTVFTLSIPVVSAAQIIVTVENVIQNPASAYTVSGTTLTFTSAPPSNTNNIWVEYTSLQTTVNALPQSPSVLGPMYVSINGATPLGGATNPIVGQSGSANNYVQSYIQNLTNAANSSADFTAYPSNGNDASGWVDMGITGSAYSQATYSVTGPNEAYLFGSSPISAGTAVTGNLVIATDANGSSNSIQFYIGGFTKAKSAYTAQFLSNGNLQFGTSNAGIVFNNSSALTNSTLNDYETGTWTPALYLGAGTVTTVSASGTYVKIGKQVTVTMYLSLGTSTSGGFGGITGLPFTVQNTSDNPVGILRESSQTGYGYEIVGNQNATSAYIRRISDNSAAISSNMSFIGTFTYISTF
jgi:hypothetical protein